MEIGAIKDITYEAGQNEYDKYLPIVEKLVDSFQITNKN
jgi:hypothetical protein